MTGANMMTDKKSWIPDDVGGGYIRGDVQEAIRRELDYRLGEGDAPGALKRWEKELILAAINMMKPNFSLSILHSQAAIKAGATIQQIRDVLLSRISTGIMRWKMAGQWALAAAEETAGQEATVEWSFDEKRRIDEIREYMRRVFHRELPNFYEKLARVSPALLDSQMRIRAIFVKPDGVIPLRLMELIITSTDTSSPFTRGESPSHARAAIKAGATVTQVIETVALAMIEGGIPVYKTAGLECIEAAEEEAAGTTGVSSLTG
jgi:alkylhydroperoxidase/carboxymuconolactone decarboxylase family protein YurZ